jgi:hypothetical protein
MIDPDLKYCPQCNDEYRAEIEKCAVCNIDLITGQQKMEMEEARRRKLESRSVELSPDDDLVVIRRGGLSDMRHLADLLDKEKIGSLIIGDEKTCGQSCCPSVYDLSIRREDAMDAIQMIEEDHKRATGLAYHDNADDDAVFNPQAGAAKCPACGHTFPTTQTTCPDCGLSFG